eukprot:7269632-Pyramimonas_sp.AAC.1
MVKERADLKDKAANKYADLEAKHAKATSETEAAHVKTVKDLESKAAKEKADLEAQLKKVRGSRGGQEGVKTDSKHAGGEFVAVMGDIFVALTAATKISPSLHNNP